jgi:hypothetical protein
MSRVKPKTTSKQTKPHVSRAAMGFDRDWIDSLDSYNCLYEFISSMGNAIKKGLWELLR